MLNKNSDLCKLIPHQGKMCLLDEVLSWDDSSIHCHSMSHLSSTNPLLVGKRLGAVNAIEYGAQAAAIHSILLAQKTGADAPKSGYLVQVKNMEIHDCDLALFADALKIKAVKLYADNSSMIYNIKIDSDNIDILNGRIMIFIKQ